MTILTSKSDRIVFEPLKGIDGTPKFHLRAGDVIERGILEGELAAPPYRAGEVFPWEKTIALRSGIETLLAGDDAIGELLDLVAAVSQGEEAKLDATQKRRLADVRAIMAEHWPEYAELVAREERRKKVAPILAFRRYCVGIEGNASSSAGPVEFKTDLHGFVSDETLKQVDPLLLAFAGNEAFLLQYGGGQVKNSARLSTSGDSQQTTEPAAKLKAAGKSARTPGKRTRG